MSVKAPIHYQTLSHNWISCYWSWPVKLVVVVKSCLVLRLSLVVDRGLSGLSCVTCLILVFWYEWTGLYKLYQSGFTCLTCGQRAILRDLPVVSCLIWAKRAILRDLSGSIVWHEANGIAAWFVWFQVQVWRKRTGYTYVICLLSFACTRAKRYGLDAWSAWFQ